MAEYLWNPEQIATKEYLVSLEAKKYGLFYTRYFFSKFM